MILHLCILEKFIAPFYLFLNDNLKEFEEKHQFYINGKNSNFRIPVGDNVIHAQSINPVLRYLLLVVRLNRAEKIFLHGLFDLRILMFLSMQPWLLKKCYWVIWGGDLYSYLARPKNWQMFLAGILKKIIIKRIKHFVTQIHGDYELAKEWYGAEGCWHECFVYPSNLYHELPVQATHHEGINILLGNSADPSNNHIEVLDKLRRYAKGGVRVYCPLSYGDQEYADKVSACGTENLGEKFVPLREFMSLEKYRDLLGKIDIAIFNHNRQQGMGNITTLLGMGKKVYLRKEITTWNFLQSLGITVFDVDSIEMTKIDKDTSIANIKIVQNYFSEANLVAQLNGAFQ